MWDAVLPHTGAARRGVSRGVGGTDVKRVGIAALLALLLVTVGCGARVEPGPAVALQETAAPVDGDGVTDPSQAGPLDGTAADGQGATSAPVEAQSSAPPPPQPGASPDYGPKHNNGVVRIELSATCVKPGDLLVITFRTPPKAGLGMIIGYSDNQPHGAMLTGESDANGVYVWRVPVDPTVPDGQATVLVTSTGANWEQEGGGTADAKFQVARGGC